MPELPQNWNRKRDDCVLRLGARSGGAVTSLRDALLNRHRHSSHFPASSVSCTYHTRAAQHRKSHAVKDKGILITGVRMLKCKRCVPIITCPYVHVCLVFHSHATRSLRVRLIRINRGRGNVVSYGQVLQDPSGSPVNIFSGKKGDQSGHYECFPRL